MRTIAPPRSIAASAALQPRKCARTLTASTRSQASGVLPSRPAPAPTDVHDQTVDPAERARGFGNDPLHVRLAGGVSDDHAPAASFLLDQVQGPRRTLPIHVRAHHGRSLA